MSAAQREIAESVGPVSGAGNEHETVILLHTESCGVHISTLGVIASHCATGWLLSFRRGDDGAGGCIQDLQVEKSELHGQDGARCQKRMRCQVAYSRLYCKTSGDLWRKAFSGNSLMLRGLEQKSLRHGVYIHRAGVEGDSPNPSA